MTLIDKDLMEKHIMESKVFTQYFKELVQSLIWGEKTIDAVEVVRCGECKRWNPDGCGYGLDLDGAKRNYGKCNVTDSYHKETHFCSYGHKRDVM